MANQINIPKHTFHLSWFSDVRRMNLKDPRQAREWVQIVLERGRSQDIRNLNLAQIKEFLPTLYLSSETRSLWQNYFNHYK